jgi:predicted lipoprotein with Yx(FWY)xxD motif
MIVQRLKTPFGAAGLLAVAVLAAACSSSGGGGGGGLYGGAPATQNVAGATQQPMASAAPVAGSATVMASTVSGQTILVAGSNGMTVYTFTKDTAGSGQSACTGGCLVKWPALTVAAGATPTGGDGVTGQLGTITRADDGTHQVTYNGLPLYFYAGDSAPGDTNGSYPNWNLVKP